MFQVGSKVRSRVNTIYRGTYTIERLNKTTAWVRADEGLPIVQGGRRVLHCPLYKNVRLSTLVPA